MQHDLSDVRLWRRSHLFFQHYKIDRKLSKRSLGKTAECYCLLGTCPAPSSGASDIINRKTSHFRHIVIFSFQFFWISPWHIVPFMNQQRCPIWNSHAGQFRFTSKGHFFIFQHGFFFRIWDLMVIKKNSRCRSTCTGTFLRPCSKLWMAFREQPSNWAIWVCVLPSRSLAMQNSFLSTKHHLYS